MQRLIRHWPTIVAVFTVLAGALAAFAGYDFGP